MLAARLALLLASSAAAQDEVGAVLRQARAAEAAPLEGVAVAAPDCREGITTRRSHQFCDDVDECQRFCACACTFDPTQWHEGSRDRSVECPRAPGTGEGLLAPDSELLVGLDGREFRFIDGARGERATAAVAEGLRRLDEQLAASAERARLDVRVRVVSCYRAPGHEVVKDCGLIRKAMHVLAKPDLEAAKREFWTVRLDPNRVGRAWPGATPHTAGGACDLVVTDASGRPCFDWRAGVAGSPVCAVDQRAASRLLDELATGDAAGGRRLDFEAWHYEWGTTAGSRCRHPACADEHWPPTGSP